MDTPTTQDQSPLELSRQLANVLRVGTVAEVRAKPTAACRVKSGELLTQWLPWISTRAGGKRARTWWPPRVGEQCVVLSPGGEMTQGLVLLGLYSDAYGPGSDKLQAARVDLSPTDYFEHDGDGNATLDIAKTITIRAGQSITLQVGNATVTLTSSALTLAAGGGRAVLDGSGLRATPDSFAGEISLKNHTHDKVAVGKANTGKPQP
jgi:phage baseplate assembly protein V